MDNSELFNWFIWGAWAVSVSILLAFPISVIFSGKHPNVLFKTKKEIEEDKQRDKYHEEIEKLCEEQNERLTQQFQKGIQARKKRLEQTKLQTSS